MNKNKSYHRELSRRDFLKLLTTGGAAAFLAACASKAASILPQVTTTPMRTATPPPTKTATPTFTPTPAPKTIVQRIQDRVFPSIFMAWSAALNFSKGFETDAAHYDLIITNEWEFELWWQGTYPGEGTEFVAERLEIGRAMRDRLLGMNPNALVLAEVRYRDGGGSWLPLDSPRWARDSAGQLVPGWGSYYMLDWHTPSARAYVVAQAKAFAESGIYDGIFLDWWDDSDPDRIKMLEEIRAAIGGEKLILVNSNTSTTPRSAAYVNGLFMEAVFWSGKTQSSNGPTTASQWQIISDTLLWAEQNLLEPRINALETKYDDFTKGLNRLRATTTLTLTHSDGYTLFANADHNHRWDPFWDHKNLGKPIAVMIKRPDGAIQREYEGGTVIYNPMGNSPVKVTFEELRQSAANGESALEFIVESTDGDLFLKSA